MCITDQFTAGAFVQTSINLKEVTGISKQRTALVFPNAILVEVGDKKVRMLLKLWGLRCCLWESSSD